MLQQQFVQAAKKCNKPHFGKKSIIGCEFWSETVGY